MRPLYPISTFNFIFWVFCFFSAEAQNSEPVSWTCQWNASQANEGTISITATLAVGWLMYSQYIDESGPLPTQLHFTPSDDYVIVGTPKEIGSPFTYFDSLYQMELTFYSYEVAFVQKIKLNTLKSTVRCEVEFMVCNSDRCIPMKENFTIPVASSESP